jgi:glutamate-1-semialdehyde 2,1-aminomutase
VTDYEGATAVGDRYPAFFRGMLERGVAFAPGAYEAIFPSLAHGRDEIAATVSAAEEVFAGMGATGA